MFVSDIIQFLETIAHPSLQENYDNAGLLVGNKKQPCLGVLISLDCTEAIVDEAVQKNCNLIVCHHPIIFSGLKKINGNNYIERTIIKAIKNDIAIFAIHTNLDNVLQGVSGKMAAMLGLQHVKILSQKNELLQKLVLFCPNDATEKVKEALFAEGAGHIGNYSQCSFVSMGIGTFNPQLGADPIVGEVGTRETLNESKIEVIFPKWKLQNILQAMKANHPYEEVAYDVFTLQNQYQEVGSGVVGEFTTAISESEFLENLQRTFKAKAIKHTTFLNKSIKKVALCGGAGSFLLSNAIAANADAYVTSDVKYHEFFDADNKLLYADIGHFESERYTIDLLFELLSNKFPTFALLKTSVNTNPIAYFV